MIYDISQPVFECEIFPGDPVPEKKSVCSMEEGGLYNLTAFSMCAHNGTHVDAPLHFIRDGKGIGELAPEKFAGKALVISREGLLAGTDAAEILQRARVSGADKRILIKGGAVVSAEAARVFAEAGVYLIGNEAQTVGPAETPMEVHLILLGAEVVLLEGIRLEAVPDGVYFLNCVPLNLGKADGAPCRAVLFDL